MNRSEEFLARQLKRMKKLSSVEEETVFDDFKDNSTNLNAQTQITDKKNNQEQDRSKNAFDNPVISGTRKSFMKSADTIVTPAKSRFVLSFLIGILIILGTFFGLIILVSIFAEDTPVQTNIIEYDVRDSVVGVEAEIATTPTDGMRNYGTAFAVTNRDFITNKHVISESIGYKIVIYHPKWENNKNSLQVRSVILKEVSDDYDIAWLQLEYVDSTINPLPVFCGKVEQGEDVYTLGYPAYALKSSESAIPEITYDKGVIKAVNRVVNNHECYEMSATINGGNSGGPLFNLNGQVIGVNTFGFDDYENCFFAIKIGLVEKAFPELWEKMEKEY